MQETDEVLFDRAGPIAGITLNRPKALNALTLGMIRAIHPRLEEWAKDPTVKVVVIRGAGDRAFCAGGDIRSVYEARETDPSLLADFFGEEYKLNYRIKTFPKPYVALLDGVSMGGGLGLSVHGSHRVATDRVLSAMPETGIGLFPDVGGGYFLPRCPGQTGMYLALTGARVKAADCLYVGIATHHTPHERLGDVEVALRDMNVSGDPFAAVSEVLSRFHVDPGPAPLTGKRALIDRCFSADTVEEIMARLAREDDAWAHETLADLKKKSPTSLKVVARQIRLGAGLDFAEDMKMEFRLVQRFMQGHDFFEGVRAVLVDKDHSPKWRPDRIEDVSEADIERYFDSLGPRELTLP